MTARIGASMAFLGQATDLAKGDNVSQKTYHKQPGIAPDREQNAAPQHRADRQVSQNSIDKLHAGSLAGVLGDASSLSDVQRFRKGARI
jgi:molybdopterin synthase catalytic subunit